MNIRKYISLLNWDTIWFYFMYFQNKSPRKSKIQVATPKFLFSFYPEKVF